jgi:hypothetical protein
MVRLWPRPINNIRIVGPVLIGALVPEIQDCRTGLQACSYAFTYLHRDSIEQRGAENWPDYILKLTSSYGAAGSGHRLGLSAGLFLWAMSRMAAAEWGQAGDRSPPTAFLDIGTAGMTHGWRT